MRRLSLWLRERPLIGDGVLAAVLFLLDVASGIASAEPVVGVAVGIGLTWPLTVRRRWPLPAAAAIYLAAAVQVLAQPDMTLRPADLAVPIAIYTLVVCSGRRVAGWCTAAVLVGVVVWTLTRVHNLNGPVLPLLALALAWALAEFVAARRAYDAEVAARLSLAESDRDRRTEDAVVAERRRIARELHDVVAHAVSVMVVQADGASLVMDRDPDTAGKALTTIAATGRQALAELRRTVLALRGPETGTDRVPVPGTTGLSELAERLRSVGLPVELELRGNLDGLPAGIGIGVHRIVAEALTNVLRHAGPGASARVCVHRRADDVEVRVIDTGGTGRKYEAGAGSGLVGMRERVAVLDGRLAVGPHEPGGDTAGWQVLALIPLG